MIPERMKAAVAHDYDDVRIEEMQVPKPGPGDVLVRVKACGVCTGDVTPWYIRKKCPIVLGHEPAGEVVEVGRSVSGFSVGDRVFVHHHAPCLRCRHCQRGNYSMCPTWRASSLNPGGMAEYLVVPKVNLDTDTLRLPDHLSWADGALVEPVACVVKAIRRSGLKRGDRVAIIGLGFIGQVMVLLARHYGAEVVIASDMVDYRLEKARQFGADRVVDIRQEDFRQVVLEMTEGIGADVVMVGPSKPAVMQAGIDCAGKGSTVLFFMAPSPDVTMEINPNQLFFNEISLVSSYSCGPDDTRQTLNLLADGVLSAEQLVTHRFSLDQTLEACRLTAQAADSLKVLVEIP
ncbi:MAG: alcohol dehydrogenase catalytic domain-containing protein [Candidatus Eremiobacteraeota bacterium]|nr:alcohol dehydrogenase catalytic domain-containing protein [Candidatus Eremiobacteraeota bacterium]